MIHSFRLMCLLFYVAMLPGLPSAADMVFPGNQWETASPRSQNVDADKLQAAVDYLATCGGSNGVNRLVVVRNGHMIWKGSEADTPQRVWSVSKAFTSTAHGLLVEDGKCSLDTLAKDFDPVLAQHYPTVTLRHLATMTSGIDCVGGSYDADDQGRSDENALVTPQQPFFPPGTKYMYWDEATQHYGYVLTEIAGESLHDFLRRRILDPIGITRFDWKPDKTGEFPNWVGGVEISAGELARFGHLFLNRGRWKDQQLINADWVDEATRVQVPATIPNGHPTSTRRGSGVYGYHWFANGTTPEGNRRWPHAPLSTYSRSGYNNNDLFVIPPWNMVVVRLGLDQRESEITALEYDTFLKMLGEAILNSVVEGNRQVWHPLMLNFRGPLADQSDDAPNPFRDYRMTVLITGPSGQTYDVPGYFDGDGYGAGRGNMWRARFAADEPGRWTYRASFRTGDGIAISLDPDAGQPEAFDGQTGTFEVRPQAADAPNFLKWGRLEYTGTHYLKFRDGPYWIRGGTDSPEDFLAYAGFDNTPPSHHYAEHVADWRPGDPDWGDGKGRGIVGALNYLASKRVNSLYFLTMNIGGDGENVWPWAGSPNVNGDPANDHLHFDLAKMRQWEMVFAHAQRRGIFLHFVFNEAERKNKQELDGGELGPERKLYYREIVARFSHHPALQWNLCEEYNINFDLGADRIRQFADYVQTLDPYDHPIAVHSAKDPLEALRFTFGDDRFSMTSIQIGQERVDTVVEEFRKETAAAGRPLPVSMDEFTVNAGQERPWDAVDDADRMRKEKLWPVYLSGGNIEFILEDLLNTESFKTPQRDKLWNYVWFARRFVEKLPFWEMEPADGLLSAEATYKTTKLVRNADRRFVDEPYEIEGQVFARPGEVYAIYLPSAEQTGKLDLSDYPGTFHLRWYNPRNGQFAERSSDIAGGQVVTLGKPPSDPRADWAVLIERATAG